MSISASHLFRHYFSDMWGYPNSQDRHSTAFVGYMFSCRRQRIEETDRAIPADLVDAGKTREPCRVGMGMGQVALLYTIRP